MISLRLSLDQRSRITRARVLGSRPGIRVFLEDAELAKLSGVIERDMEIEGEIHALPDSARPCSSYFEIEPSWFSDGGVDINFAELYLNSCKKIPDFESYFSLLCELHKRRMKYASILAFQEMPTRDAVAHRALLEYGNFPVEAVSPWLILRKFLFDLDNRSAQESGYLLETVICSALGGESYSSSKSPVTRKDDPGRGRQVDCIVGRDAFEIKLRVTIAASGQGRFREEISFPEDCKNSGFVPNLLVLDPTPSEKLEQLAEEFSKCGGRTYLGSDAWALIDRMAGPSVSRFVEKYVRKPIMSVVDIGDGKCELSLSVDPKEHTLFLSTVVGDVRESWSVLRRV